MVRVRNLILAVAASAIVFSNTALALGLGEVRLQSALNQPLVADIELLDTKGMSIADIKPRLASAEDFKRLGIDRSYFLSDLKFTPMEQPGGRQVIRVTSTKPVREPYLSFLVEALWSNGRLLREYTLLFDPPLYAPDVVAQSAPHLPGSTAEPLRPKQAPANASTPAPTGAAAPTSASTPPSASGAAKSYTVARRDTLWDISDRVRDTGTVHQNMAAIWELNPNAFVDGNVNRVMPGQVLQLPSADVVNKRTPAEAVAQMSRLYSGKAAVAQNATAEKAQRRPEAQPSADSLKLVANPGQKTTPGQADTEGSKKSKATKGGTADTQGLKDELASTRELLDASRREGAELKDRLNDLQEQLDRLTRLMQLKDNQLSDLQNQLQGQPHNAERASASTEPVATTPPAIMASAAPKALPIIPSMEEEEALEDDLLSFMAENAVLLAGVGAGVLALLLGTLLLIRRKKSAKSAVPRPASLSRNAYSRNKPSLSDSFDVPDSFADFDTPAKPKGASRVATPPADPFSDPVGDEALAKADIYMAYGHMMEAARVLKDMLATDPDNTEAHFKMMEVQGSMGNKEAFLAEEATLHSLGASDARIRQIRSKFPTLTAAASTPTDTASKADLSNTMAGLDFDALLDESVQHQAVPSSSSAPSRSSFEDRQADDLANALQEAQQGTKSGSSGSGFVDEDPFADFDWDLDAPEPAKAASTPAPAPAPAPAAQKPKSKEPDPLDDFDLSLELEPNEPAAPESKSAPRKAASPPTADEIDELLSESDTPTSSSDEVSTKLDLAKAYIEMGDQEGARDILNEVLAEGNDRQKRDARKLMGTLG